MPSRNLVSEVLDEHIALPGCLGVVVTRRYAWQWMMRLGYDQRERGFGSMEYAVMSSPRLDLPLTDLDEPSTKAFLEHVVCDMTKP